MLIPIAYKESTKAPGPQGNCLPFLASKKWEAV